MLIAHVEPPAATHLAKLEAAARAARLAVVVGDESLDGLTHGRHRSADGGGEGDEALRLVDDQQNGLDAAGDVGGLLRAHRWGVVGVGLSGHSRLPGWRGSLRTTARRSNAG